MLRKGERKALGMGLHAYRDKSGQLHYFIRSIALLGSRHQKWLGPILGEEARQIVRELWDAKTRRSLTIGPAQDVSVGYTFRQAGEKWIIALRSGGREESTISEYEKKLDRAGDYLGDKSLSAIALEDVEDMRLRLAAGVDLEDKKFETYGPLSFRSRQNVERVCSMLFAFAIKREWCDKNPFLALVSEKQPKGYKKKSSFRRLHPREDLRLLENLKTTWHRCSTAIGLYLGVRVAPTASLRVIDIDWHNEAICVPCEFNKGHARTSREDLWVPIPKRVTPFLKEQFDFAMSNESHWLFPTGVVKGRRSKSGHMHPRQISEATKAAAGLIGYTEDRSAFHALRAICNNRMRAAGIAVALDVAATGARSLLGHASEDAARPYLDARLEYLRPIISAYDKWLDKMSSTAEQVKDIRDFRKLSPA